MRKKVKIFLLVVTSLFTICMLAGCSLFGVRNKIAGATYTCTSYDLQIDSGYYLSDFEESSLRALGDREIGRSIIFDVDGYVDGDFIATNLGGTWSVQSNVIQLTSPAGYKLNMYMRGDKLTYSMTVLEGTKTTWYLEKAE